MRTLWEVLASWLTETGLRAGHPGTDRPGSDEVGHNEGEGKMETGKNMQEVLDAYNEARDILELAQEIRTYSASAGGLAERERCRKAIEQKAQGIIRTLQQ